MKISKKIQKSITITSLMLLTAVHPASADSEHVKTLSEAKISLMQAIAAAEKHLGAQAVEASLDDDNFKPAFEVSVLKDGRAYDVQVDGMTGEILGSREDIDD